MKTSIIAAGFFLTIVSFTFSSCYTSRSRRIDRREYRRSHHHQRSRGYERGYNRY